MLWGILAHHTNISRFKMQNFKENLFSHPPSEQSPLLGLAVARTQTPINSGSNVLEMYFSSHNSLERSLHLVFGSSDQVPGFYLVLLPLSDAIFLMVKMACHHFYDPG